VLQDRSGTHALAQGQSWQSGAAPPPAPEPTAQEQAWLAELASGP